MLQNATNRKLNSTESKKLPEKYAQSSLPHIEGGLRAHFLQMKNACSKGFISLLIVELSRSQCGDG
jgi:hypothetical protein